MIGIACQGHDADVFAFSGAFQSAQFVPRDEPSASAVFNVRVTLAGARNAKPMVRGADSFMSAFKDRPGYIYLLESVHGYKIGRTNDPSRRVNQIKLILPFEVRLIHLIRAADVVMAEWFIHELFSEQHIRGEWFNLSPEDVAFIKSMGSMESYQYLYGLIEDVPIDEDVEPISEEAM